MPGPPSTHNHPHPAYSRSIWRKNSSGRSPNDETSRRPRSRRLDIRAEEFLSQSAPSSPRSFGHFEGFFAPSASLARKMDRNGPMGTGSFPMIPFMWRLRRPNAGGAGFRRLFWLLPGADGPERHWTPPTRLKTKNRPFGRCFCFKTRFWMFSASKGGHPTRPTIRAGRQDAAPPPDPKGTGGFQPPLANAAIGRFVPPDTATNHNLSMHFFV